MSRPTSCEIISAFRATSVVDTPMRKIEVLEDHSGRVLLRATEYNTSTHADVKAIWLEHHEAQALAKTIFLLEDQPDDAEFAGELTKAVVSGREP